MAIGKALESVGESAAVRRHGGLPPKEISEEERAAVLALLAQGEGVTEAARQVWPDTPLNTARKWSRRVAQEAGMVGEEAPPAAPPTPPPSSAVPAWAVEEEPDHRFPRSDAPRADQWPRLSGDFLVMSDLHVPYHDADLLEKAVADARRLGIRQWVVVGDLMDGNQWSKRGLQTGYQRRWQDDAEMAAAIVRQLVRLIGPGTVLMGNHDAWFVKHFKGQAEAEWLLSRMFGTGEGDVLWSRYEQAEIVSGGRTIRATHGANYSGANPLGVGQRLAAKWESGVVMGHQHHATHGLSWSGRHQVVCMGGMHDPTKLAYIHESPRTNPSQTRSYVLLKDGYMKHVLCDGPAKW